MALETLKGFSRIDGEKVFLNKTKGSGKDGAQVYTEDMGDTTISWEDFGDKFREEHPIGIHHESNLISFKIQNGPIKENGKNGCQVTALIEAAKIIIGKLNHQYYSPFNDRTLYHLDSALDAQAARTKDRENRNVEGKSLQ